MCKNPQVDTDRPAVVELMADVAAAVARRAAAVHEDVYEVILRDIPELRQDKPVLALLRSSVLSNVDTCLQVLQHQIDLADVQAPAMAVEYARRQAQRGMPLSVLLRAYRVGHTCFTDWLLRELARQTDDPQLITAATLGMSKVVAGYVDQTSEEIVAAYTRERESWLRSRSAARAARVRALLSGARIDLRAAEATLGYRLRQYHAGVVCWTDEAPGPDDNITRLERAVREIAEQVAGSSDPVFLPCDESSAWAWLPLGIRDTFTCPASGTAGVAGDSPMPRAVTFGEVAPVAMMLGSAELLRAWVLSTLAGLAADDEHHARLRDTLLVFLESGGSYKTAAERLMLHKNTVQYRIRKAQESLGRPIGGNRHDVELALQASRWLGASVLQPVTEVHNRERAP